MFSLLNFDLVRNTCASSSGTVSSISEISPALVHMHILDKKEQMSDKW